MSERKVCPRERCPNFVTMGNRRLWCRGYADTFHECYYDGVDAAPEAVPAPAAAEPTTAASCPVHPMRSQPCAICGGFGFDPAAPAQGAERYKVNVSVGQGMSPDPNGEWVRYAELARLREELAEETYLRERLAQLLAGVAVSLKGPEPALTLWSYHDLPEIALATALDAHMKTGRAEKAEADAKRGADALRELVALKTMKDDALPGPPPSEYKLRQALAWQAARAYLRDRGAG